MNSVQIRCWERHILPDLAAVVQLLNRLDTDHLGYFEPVIRAAVARNDLLPSAFMLLVSRALCQDRALSRTVHTFAAAMELVMVVVEGHARLPEQRAPVNTDDGRLSPGTAPGVLLGDLLYTHAFCLVTGTAHHDGLACLAAITEDMVTATIRAVGAGEKAGPVLSSAGCAGCARLAALLCNATGEQACMLRDLGDRFGVLLGLWRCQRTRCLPEADVPARPAAMEVAAAQCRALLHVALEASTYRDELYRLVDFLAQPDTGGCDAAVVSGR